MKFLGNWIVLRCLQHGGYVVVVTPRAFMINKQNIKHVDYAHKAIDISRCDDCYMKTKNRRR